MAFPPIILGNLIKHGTFAHCICKDSAKLRFPLIGGRVAYVCEARVVSIYGSTMRGARRKERSKWMEKGGNQPPRPRLRFSLGPTLVPAWPALGQQQAQRAWLGWNRRRQGQLGHAGSGLAPNFCLRLAGHLSIPRFLNKVLIAAHKTKHNLEERIFRFDCAWWRSLHHIFNQS